MIPINPNGLYEEDGPVIIPSNFITMENIHYPVLGIDNLGNKKLMQPNRKYRFAGDNVLEIPLSNTGGYYSKDKPTEQTPLTKERFLGAIRNKEGIYDTDEAGGFLRQWSTTPEGKKLFKEMNVQPLYGPANTILGWGNDDFFVTNPEDNSRAKVNQADVDLIKNQKSLREYLSNRGVKSANNAELNYPIFQYGGDSQYVQNDYWQNYDQTSPYANVLDLLQNTPQGDFQDYQMSPSAQQYPVNEEDDVYYAQQSAIDELNAKISELEGRLSTNTGTPPSDNSTSAIMDYILYGSTNNTPIDWSNVASLPSMQQTSPNESWEQDLVQKESGGDYGALNPNSSAVGKYQFLWDTWAPNIKKITGISSKEEFRNNPQAQEVFYAWYKQNELLPSAQKLQSVNRKGLSAGQLAKLVHFKGEAGARKWLTKGIDNTTAHNISIDNYIN